MPWRRDWNLDVLDIVDLVIHGVQRRKLPEIGSTLIKTGRSLNLLILDGYCKFCSAIS